MGLQKCVDTAVRLGDLRRRVTPTVPEDPHMRLSSDRRRREQSREQKVLCLGRCLPQPNRVGCGGRELAARRHQSQSRERARRTEQPPRVVRGLPCCASGIESIEVCSKLSERGKAL